MPSTRCASASTRPRAATGSGSTPVCAGNANVGHEFRAGFAGGPAEGGPQYGVIGPYLTPDERWAIVEYLKVHEDPAAAPGRTPAACVAR